MMGACNDGRWEMPDGIPAGIGLGSAGKLDTSS